MVHGLIVGKPRATPLDEIPADSTCLVFQRARAEQAMKAAKA